MAKIICTNCGEELYDDDKFCTNCGQRTAYYRATKNMKKRQKQAKQRQDKEKRVLEEKSEEVKRFQRNQLKYVEDKVKESYPNAKLASFEKKYIRDIKLNGSNNEMNNQLNSIINKIISNHEKVEPYDFDCSLLEDGGFHNRGFKREHRRLEKKRDLETYIFIKLMDNRIETFGSKVYPEIKLFSPTIIQSGDRTIFFNEISNIVFEDSQITLNLQNHDKLRLVSRDYSQIGKDKEQKFRELLNEKWITYKENENGMSISKNNQSESNITGELMRIAELYEKGLLTEEEFSALKKKLLGL